MLLLVYGPLGIQALWTNYIPLAKTIFLFTLMGLLSYVPFSVQPKIDDFFADVTPESTVPEVFLASVKPLRVLRKRLATDCLFLVLTTIIFGRQTNFPYSLTLNMVLIRLAGLFSWLVHQTLIRFGWL